MSEIYIEKVKEAEAIAADENASAPLLTAEADIRGMSKEDLALMVLAKRDETKDNLIKLELIRTEFNLAIQAAKTEEDKESALTTYRAKAVELWRLFSQH